ncbi:MAG TPA: glycosyltransferase family 4 protein [Bryobacteraceae bacterium]
MTTLWPSRTSAKAVMLVAPQAPPYGGMAIQARLLAKLLEQEGTPLCFFASNFPLPRALLFCNRIPLARTAIRAVAVWFKLLKQVPRVDVIHVFAASWLYFFMAVAPAILVGKLLRKRVVVNYRGGDAARFFRYWGWAAAPLLRMADVLTAPSKFLADLIQERFRLPVTIVKNILDQSVFQYRRRTAIQPKVVVARHLEPIYGVESVLLAFRAIQHQFPDASLAIVGTGSEEARLRALAGQWQLGGVSFLGHIDHRQMQRVYEGSDIFLNGSLVDNFPGALLEASAAGLVVVSTGAGGIPSMYEDGRNALLVEPGDWQALAAAVVRVLQSPALAQELIEGGGDLVGSCCWNKVRLEIYGVYGFLQDAAVAPQNAIATG